MLPTRPSDAPPPPPPLQQSSLAVSGRRAGELTMGWRVVLALAWAGIFVGFSVTWKASRDIGLSTWWLGPLGEPRPVYVTVLPFVAPSGVLAGILGGVRHLPWLGLAAAVATAAIGIGDIGRVNDFALVELSLAAGGAAVSLATLAGRLRPVR